MLGERERLIGGTAALLDWITRLLLGFWFVVPASSPTAGESEWEQIYELPAAHGWLTTVWAGDAEWVAAGKEVIVRGGDQRAADRTTMAGKAILGLDRVGSDLYALGADQFILHFDGKAWTEEHHEPSPARASPRQKYAAVLYRTRTLEADGKALTVAYGPWRVLVRQQPGAWRQTEEAERSRLNALALHGPEIQPPPKCSLAAWWWLPGDRAWFTCHDGRSFVRDRGKTDPTGTLPKACHASSDGVAQHGAELNLLCGGKAWRSENGRWVSRSIPKGTAAIAANARCLYAITARAVSRQCGQK